MKKILLKISIILLCFLCINVKAAECDRSLKKVKEDSNYIYCCPRETDVVKDGYCYIRKDSSVKNVLGTEVSLCSNYDKDYSLYTIDDIEYCIKKDENNPVVKVDNSDNICGSGFSVAKTDGTNNYCCKDGESLITIGEATICATVASDYYISYPNECSVGTYYNGKCYDSYASAKVVDSEGTIKIARETMDETDFETDVKKEESDSKKKIENAKVNEFSVSYTTVNVCELKSTISVMKTIGIAIAIIKLLIPVILVITSTISLGKAVILEDNTDIKKYTHVFITKFIISVCVFFLPTIIIFIYNMAKSSFTNLENYDACVNCALDYKSCPTEGLKCIYTCSGDACEESEDQTAEFNNGIAIDYVETCQDNTLQDCSTLLGDPTLPKYIAYYLQMALNIMKWSGLVLTILMTVIDIFKYIFGENKDMAKLIVGNAIKRLSYACMLLFLPTLVNLLFTLLGLYGTCGIA